MVLRRSRPRDAANSMSSMQASGKAQLGGGELVPDALVGTHGDLAVEYQAEPLVAAELIGAALFVQFAPGGGHPATPRACI